MNMQNEMHPKSICCVAHSPQLEVLRLSAAGLVSESNDNILTYEDSPWLGVHPKGTSFGASQATLPAAGSFKKLLTIFVLLTLPVMITSVFALADQNNVLDNANHHRQAALEEYQETVDRINLDRDRLKAELSHHDSALIQIKAKNSKLQSELDARMAKASDLQKSETGVKEDASDLAAIIRIMQKDMTAAIETSSLYPVYRDEFSDLNRKRNPIEVPGINEITSLTDMAFRLIKLESAPLVKEGTFVGRDGAGAKGSILTLGRFFNAYVTGNEAGFLWPSESTGQMVAYSSLPDRSTGAALKAFASGTAEVVSLDLSGGAATARFAKKSGLTDKIREGGPLVWPILAIGLAALLIIMERSLAIIKSYTDSDKTMIKIENLSGKDHWDRAAEILKAEKPLQRVLLCALKNRDEDKESLETLVHESIIREVRYFERFLPTLNVLGAIAPLLGLLGTVTGMISTFQSITIYGTGDPRMMAGGISEALITTMLGLTVAIPIMFFHNFLSRRGFNIIDDIEEKAVTLVNIIHKEKSESKDKVE
ncbi:MAG: MotA/TolQ/ExbB proton channel family protein [Proteobacteria bacterium]|nr:MotA/TolQ/ExbB proton channel family protein [Pseudomonadota bacterium]MBU1714098.1 MotA/TolQ/ExbB proton channel family protein [Pseudomonadota bacterium]